MKKVIFLFLFISPSVIFALPTLQSLTANLSEEDTAEVLEKGDCHRDSERQANETGDMIWLPDHYLGSKIHNLYREMEPGLVVEIVSFIPMEKSIVEDPDLIRQVANKFLNVSGQAGIRYYSSSRKKEMELIEDSYTIDNLKDKEQIDDFSFSEIPGVTDLNIYQKDTSFGKNYYNYHCELFEDSVLLTTTNITDLTVMKFFTVARPEENIMAYAIIPCEEGLYIYTSVFVNDPPKQKKILGVSVYIQGFFLKRVRKIIEWFSLNFVLQSL